LNRLLGVSEEDLTTFEVDGTEAVMSGVINGSTPDMLRDLIADHPEVTTIVMVLVPGSIDDTANLEASLLVRDAGLNTHATGLLASGGVDFFLAGNERTAGPKQSLAFIPGPTPLAAKAETCHKTTPDMPRTSTTTSKLAPAATSTGSPSKPRRLKASTI